MSDHPPHDCPTLDGICRCHAVDPCNHRHTLTLTDEQARAALAALMDAHTSAVQIRTPDASHSWLAICSSAYRPAITALIAAIGPTAANGQALRHIATIQRLVNVTASVAALDDSRCTPCIADSCGECYGTTTPSGGDLCRCPH
jgi:hypothetical protein